MKKRNKLAAMCMSLLLLTPSISVLAADNAEITMKGDTAEGNSQIKISCEIDTPVDVTSGKLRIHYDSSQLTLVSDSTGAALSEGLNEINDPLTGNREPGEIILAFAAAQPIAQQGSLLDMDFQVTGDVKAGDTIDVSAEVEQLAGEDGDVEASVSTASIILGDKAETPSDDTGTTGSTKVPESSQAATSEAGTGNTGKSTKSVKTGDAAGIMFPILGLGGAAVIAAAAVLYKKKKQ